MVIRLGGNGPSGIGPSGIGPSGFGLSGDKPVLYPYPLHMTPM